MRSIRFYVVAAFLALLICFGQTASGQGAAGDWFPSHAGDRWIYDNESRDVGEGPTNREIHRWQTDETILGTWTIPEGTLMTIAIRFAGGSPPPRVRVDRTSALLLSGDCVYLRYVEWRAEDHQLTPAFRKDLLAGHISPDFCFPLTEGKIWGAPHWGDWRPPSEAKDWQVTGMGAPDAATFEGQPSEGRAIFHIASLWGVTGSGQIVNIWFEKHIGIVRGESAHNGTFSESGMRLLRFESASGR